MLTASVLWALGSFSAARLTLPADPFAGSAYQVLAGGAAGILVDLCRGEQHGLDPASYSTASWLALGYLVLRAAHHEGGTVPIRPLSQPLRKIHGAILPAQHQTR
ncbi:hypothetical protein [Streptomyces sp. ICC1]|uniref:hypothetical protein n=1 Tax=Streptomyces sp. ICC1 TaxID=2099583 RepID=UPI0013A6B161|nr:hypothetical protein [Streptomyces sp. ICC1]